MRNKTISFEDIKTFLGVFSIGICMCGCAKQATCDEKEVFYYAESDYVYSESIQLDSTRLLFNRYYPNKMLLEKMNHIKGDSAMSVRHGRHVDWAVHGPCMEYYEDGFPKQSYVADSGLLLWPYITGEMGPHKIIVDIQKEKCRFEGKEGLDPFYFHRFRIYVEGIPLVHYFVSILTQEGNSPRGPLKCDYKRIATYQISPEPNSQKDTSSVEIDETLYQYILTEYDNKWCLRDSNGVQGYLFGIHYADTTGWIGEKPRETIFVPFQSDF